MKCNTAFLCNPNLILCHVNQILYIYIFFPIMQFIWLHNCSLVVEYYFLNVQEELRHNI